VSIRIVCLTLALCGSAFTVSQASTQGATAQRVMTVPQVMALCGHRQASLGTVRVRGFFVDVFTGSAGPSDDGALFAHPQRSRLLRNVPSTAIGVFQWVGITKGPQPPNDSWIVAHGQLHCGYPNLVLQSFRLVHKP
jgi:hypothetical protein